MSPAHPDDALAKLVDELARGRAGADDLEPLAYAHLDHDRCARQGMPEVVFGAGKSPEQIVGIVARLLTNDQPVLVTRLEPDIWEACRDGLGDAGTYDALSRTWLGGAARAPADDAGAVVVVSAGTSDVAVAEEAARTAEAFGQRVVRLNDVGVAGIHRLIEHLPTLRDARVIIAVAGMEGALPSVVAGLVACPVIAVPTSVGYGASFGGVAALLAMLNSCASGVTVVNIDNGFGAACAAVRIAAVTSGAKAGGRAGESPQGSPGSADAAS